MPSTKAKYVHYYLEAYKTAELEELKQIPKLGED